jgi:hypothetical protein
LPGNGGQGVKDEVEQWKGAKRKKVVMESERETVEGMVVELVDDNMIINEHDVVLLIRSIAVEIPAGSHNLFLEGLKDGLFDVVRDGHVILDSIEAIKDNIEEAYLSQD